MKALSIVLAMVLFSTACSTTRANELVNIGIEENFKQADLVVVAVVTQSGIAFRPDRPDSLAAEFTVEATLKGRAEKPTILVPYRYSVESSFRCCEVGKRYMLFLNKFTPEVYYPVDGRFSLYEIGENPPKPTPAPAAATK